MGPSYLGTTASYDRVIGRAPFDTVVGGGWGRGCSVFKSFFHSPAFRPSANVHRTSSSTKSRYIYSTAISPLPPSNSFSLFLLKALPINPFQPTLQAFSFRGTAIELKPFDLLMWLILQRVKCPAVKSAFREIGV